MSATQTQFLIGPSRRLGLALAVAAIGGIGAAAASALPGPVLPVLTLLVGLVAVHAWRTAVVRSAAGAVVALGRDVDGEWWLRTRSGRTASCRLASLCLHPLAVFLACRCDDRNLATVIARDAMSADDFRRLCVLLRTLPPAPASGEP